MPGIRTSRRSSGKLSLQSMSVHFAVVTVLATGALAMFVDSDQTDRAIASAADTQAQADDAISQAAHGAARNLIKIRDRGRNLGSFGPDTNHIQSSSSLAFAGGSEPGVEPGTGLPRTAVRQPSLPTTLPPGMTLEEWLALHGDHEESVPAIQLSPNDIKAMTSSSGGSSIKPVG